MAVLCGTEAGFGYGRLCLIMTELLNIAVVEDEKVHAAIIIRLLETWLKEREIKFHIQEFPDGEAFLFEWEQNQAWNALFFDIQMPGLNGMELARRIRKENRRVAIVFVTGITDYLQEGYEVEALHYLIKPIDEEKVGNCMKRIVEKYNRDEKHSAMLIEAQEMEAGGESGHVTIRLRPEDIVYAEAFAHNTELHTRDKCYRVREGIGVWRKRLPQEAFISCHRSYLVNLKYVARVEKEAVVLDNGKAVPMSRRSYKAVNQAFIQLYRRI